MLYLGIYIIVIAYIYTHTYAITINEKEVCGCTSFSPTGHKNWHRDFILIMEAQRIA